MKTIDEIIQDNIGNISGDSLRNCMKQYAVEAINELVDEMLAYPPNELSEGANLIHIANRIKRSIHGVVIETINNDKTSK